ncbi:MAG: AAA family ATPase [Erysipelotrichaceae bacterium]|nr:AAA family ATPase [Erysipelotrichaceae bacterium]
MKKEEREKLLEEVLNKKRDYNSIYTDSLKVIDATEKELNRMLSENKKGIDELVNKDNYNDAYLNSLKNQMENDFNVKIDVPEKVVVGKASKEVFDLIEKELKETIVGQDEACERLCMAFRRPYITGSDPKKVRNSIVVYGTNGTGRHQLINSMGQLLKKNGLTVSSEVYVLDMKRYQSSTQEILFLQDLYVALVGKNPIILIENFKEASPIFNRMLSELVLDGRCLLNQRYTFANNQLQEATAKLSKDVIDHLDGNDKTLVFISEDNPTKLMDVFGKSFVDKIEDKIQTVKFSEEALTKIIEQLLKDLELKSETQFELDLIIDDSLKTYLKENYEPNDGIDSLTPIINKIYNCLVNITLKNDGLNSLTLIYDETIKARFNEKELDLDIVDDESQERKEIQAELDEIVGLNSVKDYLLSLENNMKIMQIRKQKGLKVTEVSKHMIFTGNPGTGKTTIARIVSRMMKAAGILKQGQLVEVTRADLVGKYVGHTAPLTMNVINSALGGVLFIDEAYSLYRGKDDSFGLEAIDTIVKGMEDHRNDLIVILAGYTKEMSEFLTANSGLKSRFANIIQFDDYTGEEMMLIAKSIAKSKGYFLNEECDKPLQEYFTIIQAKGDPNTGNGRLARNKVEEAILKQAKRLLDNPDDDISELKLEDFNLSD